MKYHITIKQDWFSPYGGTGDPIRNIETSEYETESFELANKIISDELDVPIAELSLDRIRQDFAVGAGDLPEEQLVGIQRYYNGRLAIFRAVQEDLKKHKSTPGELKYDIPDDYNHFEIFGDRPENERQNEAYLKVMIEK